MRAGERVASALPTLRSHPRRWRVDVVLSTNSVSRVLRPCLLLRTRLTDGRVHTFEVSVARFHELRHAVAEALHTADAASERLQPAAKGQRPR